MSCRSILIVMRRTRREVPMKMSKPTRRRAVESDRVKKPAARVLPRLLHRLVRECDEMIARGAENAVIIADEAPPRAIRRKYLSPIGQSEIGVKRIRAAVKSVKMYKERT